MTAESSPGAALWDDTPRAPVQGGVQIRFPESHRPADLVTGDQSGHAPAVEVAFAHGEEGTGVLFGE